MACHNGLTAPNGEDISMGFEWRPSMMANSARDPYWHAGVAREIRVHPQARAVIEDECSACHMPMIRYEAKVSGGTRARCSRTCPSAGSAAPAAHLAADGTSCTVCHQITADKLGTRESFAAGFVVQVAQPAGGPRSAFGPFLVDAGRVRIHAVGDRLPAGRGGAHPASRSSARPATRSSRTRSGPGARRPASCPEQVPYLEWRHSAYRAEPELPVVPHAGGRRRGGDQLRARPAEERCPAPRVPRRQLPDAADAEPVPAGARGRGAAAGARRRRPARRPSICSPSRPP